MTAVVPVVVPLASALLDGEPLHSHALRAARAVVPGCSLGLGASLGEVLGASPAGDGPLLVHDPLCPLTPPSFLDEVLAGCRPASALVAFAPMTDTVKAVRDGLVRSGVERDRLRVLASPLVLEAAVLRGLDAGTLAACADLAAVVALLSGSGVPLGWVPAPPAARRVDDAASLALLECLSDLGGPAGARPAAGRPRT